MPTKKQIQPGEKVPLKLTITQRKLVLGDLLFLDEGHEQIIQGTPSGKPVWMTLADLDDFGGYIAAEANHCDDGKKQKKLGAVFQKVQAVLDKYTDEEPPETIKTEDAKKAEMISERAVQMAEWAAEALVIAGQLRIKTKPLEDFSLTPGQRKVLILVPGISKSIKNKLAKHKPITVAESVSMTMALAEDLPDGNAQRQLAILVVANDLMSQVQVGITRLSESKLNKQPKAKTKAAPGTLLQFKITLLDFEPSIWRRIQVQDCTLDKLHEHIQTSMGWTNSHLHQFEIKGQRYGDPELLDDGFEEFDCADSTVTMVVDVVPTSGKRFAFHYKYDFGDGWEHDVLFEGFPEPEKGKKYPLCLEGERACPPEDVGGVWGYRDFLTAISDPKHEEHESFLEWCGSPFSPDEFDPKQAAKAMKNGLPDWRNR